MSLELLEQHSILLDRLKRHGRHAIICPLMNGWDTPYEQCKCGLSEVIAAAQKLQVDTTNLDSGKYTVKIAAWSDAFGEPARERVEIEGSAQPLFSIVSRVDTQPDAQSTRPSSVERIESAKHQLALAVANSFIDYKDVDLQPFVGPFTCSIGFHDGIFVAVNDSRGERVAEIYDINSGADLCARLNLGWYATRQSTPGQMVTITRNELLESCGLAYTSHVNAHKPVDATLCQSIVDEVFRKKESPYCTHYIKASWNIEPTDKELQDTDSKPQPDENQYPCVKCGSKTVIAGNGMRQCVACVHLFDYVPEQVTTSQQTDENGPEFGDGCSRDGFVGGCERMGCHPKTITLTTIELLDLVPAKMRKMEHSEDYNEGRVDALTEVHASIQKLLADNQPNKTE